MARGRSILTQRTLWTLLVGLAAVAFWIVALGVGLRGWLTLGPRPGLVGHVTEFGERAAPYMITASVLTLTTALMGVGTALVRHLVDGRASGGEADSPSGPTEPAVRASASEPAADDVGEQTVDAAAEPARDERRGR